MEKQIEEGIAALKELRLVKETNNYILGWPKSLFGFPKEIFGQPNSKENIIDKYLTPNLKSVV